MPKVVLRFMGLDRYGYEDMLYEIQHYPRSKGEQIVLLRKRKTRPRTIEVMIRSNLTGMVVLDLTCEAGGYELYEKVDGKWEER